MDIEKTAKEFNDKVTETRDNIREFIEKMPMPDPEVDAIGVVGPADYPEELKQFRLNFLNEVIKISDNLKLYYVEMVESFFKIIVKEQWLQKGQPIDCGLLWNGIVKTTRPPELKIDFEKLLPQQEGLGLAVPKCQAIGKVIKKETK